MVLMQPQWNSTREMISLLQRTSEAGRRGLSRLLSTKVISFAASYSGSLSAAKPSVNYQSSSKYTQILFYFLKKRTFRGGRKERKGNFSFFFEEIGRIKIKWRRWHLHARRKITLLHQRSCLNIFLLSQLSEEIKMIECLQLHISNTNSLQFPPHFPELVCIFLPLIVLNCLSPCNFFCFIYLKQGRRYLGKVLSFVCTWLKPADLLTLLERSGGGALP